MDTKELKLKWKKEKESYKKQEVGSGVQIFVKDMLASEEIFKLAKGLKSTPEQKRSKEFLEEEGTKAQRQADIIIYISPDIIIPVEVERYENIEAGKEQLLTYQADLDKKYGILTDGYHWRFYNNNAFREFTLPQILDETDLFLEFWEEYIKPEFYYLSFFEKIGQKSLLRETEFINVGKNREMFFENITKLIRGFKNKLQIEGYFKGLEKTERAKRAIEITYAYIIQFILYKTLVDNDFGEFKSEFDNQVKKIHECVKNQRYKDILGIIDSISVKISKNIYRPFSKEQDFIRNKLLELYQSIENKLSDVSPWLDIFVFIRKYDFSNIENEIFGYIYENYLKELYEETQKGQYFTDPAVVNFMLEQIGFTDNNVKKSHEKDKESISLIDPSCGSGTFLYRSVDTLINAFGNHTEEKSKKIEEAINNNIFGLDIAEFPLYLAEMNILMRMLPMIVSEKYNNPIDKKIKVFLTRDSIAEFMDTALKNTIHDIQVAGGQQSLGFADLDLGYKSYVREESDLAEMKKSLEIQPNCPRRRFDYVIGNPPYIGYNECSKQKVLTFELMKKGKASLNNMYGINLHSVPDHRKKYAPKPNLYVFFIALGIALLKDNGKLCYIIPQTILTAGDLDVIRYHLAKFTTIEKIITFSGKMFVGRGLKQKTSVATSSLVFVLNRRKPSLNHSVEIINYEHPDDSIEDCLQNIRTGKKTSKKMILQTKLLSNTANWNFVKHNKSFLSFWETYKNNSEGITIYYSHVLAEQKFGSKFFFDIGYNIDEKRLLENGTDDDYQYPKFDSTFWGIRDCKGYWKNQRDKGAEFEIKLLTTNQGYNLLDSPHKILWSYANPKRFHFSSKPLIWARNQICSIGSRNKRELLYLFSLLNSSTNQRLLNATLKNENEKDLLVSLASVKSFIRVPKISAGKDKIKIEIMKCTEMLLGLENYTLADFVNFSSVMTQKFDTVEINQNQLVLKKGDKRTSLPITKNLPLVKKCLAKRFPFVKLINKGEISLSTLKHLPIIDDEKQKDLKEYIDDLVFTLYFNIPCRDIGLDKALKIRNQCQKNELYKILTAHK